jgi:co-chaperonin GroES (HSP10)
MSPVPKLFLAGAAGNNRGDPVYSSIEDAWPAIEPFCEPLGSLLLVQMRLPPLQLSGAFEVSQDDRMTERDNCQIGKVIAIGPLAFRNRETAQIWPEGAWCTVGDFVIVPKYQGERTRTKHKRTQTYYSHEGTERTRPVEDDIEVVLFKDLAILGKIGTADKAMSFRNFL